MTDNRNNPDTRTVQQAVKEQDYRRRHDQLALYVRQKINQLLKLMGTLPLDPEELTDDMLIDLDPIGIVSESFAQVLENLESTNEELVVAKTELQSILDAVGAGIVVMDHELVIEAANPLSEKILLGDDEEDCSLIGRHCTQIRKPGDNQDIETLLNALLSGEISHAHTEVRLQQRYYDLIITPLKKSDQEPIKLILLFLDITHKKEVESKLRMTAAVFDNTVEGIVITDADNYIVAVNGAFCQITGYSMDEAIGRRPSMLRSHHHDDEFYKQLWQSLKEEGHWRGEIWNRKKDGEIFVTRQAISVIYDDNGEIENHVSVMADISNLKASQEKLDYLAYHDTLTGLANRFLLNDRLEQAIKHAQRRDTMVGVLFMDLDRFKTINDSLGHPIGDQLLVEIARRLKTIVREEDTVARPSGDEFVIVMEDIKELEVAGNVAGKLIDIIQQPVSAGGSELHVTGSVGISIYPDDGKDANTLIKNADSAMYLAKDAGKNNYKFYTHNLTSEATDRLVLENELRQAIEKQAFRIWYQPLFDIENDALIGVEALLRWKSSLLGDVSPMRFIPVAEETGLIVPIGEWVLEHACRQMVSWEKAGINIDRVSVNMSGVQLQDPDISEKVSEIIERTGINKKKLELEITENVIMQPSTVERLRILHQLGISIAVDDFGTGYSSLSYLKKLPLDRLKIDRSFIADIPNDINDKAISEAIVAMGHSLGLKVIAEGIETREQRLFLSAIHCDEVQGYLYGKPMPAEELVNRYFYTAPGAEAESTSR